MKLHSTFLNRQHKVASFHLSVMCLQIGALAASLLFLYAQVLNDLARMWLDHDRLEGFLIPGISLYLVWLKREQLRQLPVKPAASWGFPVTVFAGILLLLGGTSGIAVLGEVSLIVMTVGLVLFLGGGAYLKSLSLPIAYLFFMLSIVEDIVAPLHGPFQLLTAKMAGEFLHILGIAAFVEGEYITLSTITLEVGKECSGVNYLISIIAVGLPLAVIALNSWWNRIALVFSAVAIGVVANWARVVFIGIWAYWGGEVLHGPFHVFQGMFVAWVGFVALFAGAWGLSKLDRTREDKRVPGAPWQGHSLESKLQPRLEWKRLGWIALAVVLMFAACKFWYDERATELPRSLATFSVSVGEWTGREIEPYRTVFRLQGADEELARIYRNPKGQEIQLYIGYLKFQRQGKEIVNYLTALLHQHVEGVSIDDGRGGTIHVNQGRLVDRENARPVIFWYDINGQAIADRYQAKLSTVLGAVRRGHTNGALVLITGTSTDDIIPLVQMQAFARDLLPILRGYLL